MKLESQRDQGMMVEKEEEEKVDEEVDVVVEVDEEVRRRRLALTELQHVILGQ